MEKVLLNIRIRSFAGIWQDAHLCYLGRRTEDVAEQVDSIVVNTSEKAVFVYLIETNNVD